MPVYKIVDNGIGANTYQKDSGPISIAPPYDMSLDSGVVTLYFTGGNWVIDPTIDTVQFRGVSYVQNSRPIAASDLFSSLSRSIKLFPKAAASALTTAPFTDAEVTELKKLVANIQS